MSLRQSTIILRRCFSVNAPACQAAADPIQVKIFYIPIQNWLRPQNLFAQKIKEYGDKKAKAGGKLVDATPASNAELQAELDKVENSWL